MKIVPKKEEELTKFELLPDGTYPFSVIGSLEQASKSEANPGKMMIGVKLNVHGPKGDRHVYDYFADWFSEWKLKHFCDTTGLQKEYEAGEVVGADGAFIGRTGFVTLAHEDAGKYPAKNVVEDYVVKEAAKPQTQAANSPKPPEENDDVPFN